MTPLQSFKKLCVVGAQCCFTADWCLTPTTRTVTFVQTRKVAFTHPFRPGATSWLDFPKAGEIEEVKPGRFQIKVPGYESTAGLLTYDFGDTKPLDLDRLDECAIQRLEDKV